jgi:sugar/nucleoside kinase (ribokinase family)
MSLLTVGTVAFDSIQTPLGKADRIVGGAANYISLAAAYFTNPVKLVSVIGDDFPEGELDHMRDQGIHLDGLQVRKGENSFFWAGKYHENMNSRDTLETQLNVLADFDPELPASYRNPEYVMLGNLTPAVQQRVLDQLEERPRLIAMDTMNFWMDTAMESLLKVIGQVDVLVINDEEARQLSGEYSLVKASQMILDLGPKYLVIKKGEHGALLFYDEHIFFAPALPLAEVFDPTGAGDTFAGGFIGALGKASEINFETMARAIVAGSAMASFCVEKFGPERIAQLTDTEIAERTAKFGRLVDPEGDLF